MLGKATRLLRRGRPAVTIEELSPPAAGGPLPPSPPQLIVLVPNVVGIGSFKINTFGDAESAAAFLPTVPQDLQSGVLAFWALPKQPPLDNTALLECGEALVMLRSPADPETVYVVSFVNIETAESFARFEVQRGLAMEHLQLHWASLVNIVGTEDGVLIHPSSPPDPDARQEEAPARGEDMKLLEAEIEAELRAKRQEAAREVAAQAARALGTAPLVQRELPPEYEITDGQAYLEVSPLPEEVLSPHGERLLAPVPAGAQPDPRADALAVLNTIAPVDGAAFLLPQPFPKFAIALTSDQAPERLVVTHQPVLEAVMAEAAPARRVPPPEFEVVESGGAESPDTEPVAEDGLLPAIVVARQPARDSTALSQLATQRPASEDSLARQAKPAIPQSAAVDIAALDAATMLAQVFAARRWQQQDKPFRGFDSPPGRF